MKKNKKRNRYAVVESHLIIIMLLLGVGIAGLWFAISHSANTTGGNSEDSRQDIQIQTEESTDLQTEENFDAQTRTDELAMEIREIYEENEKLLVLVNKEYALPADYEVELKMLDNGREQVAEVLYEDLTEMLEGASEEGGYSYYLVSGYRDAEYQQELVDQDVASYMEQYGMTEEEALEKTLEQVMPAGHSEHETGLAMDISAAGHTELDETQAEEPAIIWLQENCWKYGFILRYPEDKEDITQISYEPWHFRYVGREAARLMYENNWTLEEFTETVRGMGFL